jgi:hypothetical protein
MHPEKTDRFRTVEEAMQRLAQADQEKPEDREKPEASKSESRDEASKDSDA